MIVLIDILNTSKLLNRVQNKILIFSFDTKMIYTFKTFKALNTAGLVII